MGRLTHGRRLIAALIAVVAVAVAIPAYARDPLGIGGRDREADWPAPVVAHLDQLLEVELPHQLADHPGMLGRRVAVPGRPVGETEAEIVDGDTAEGALQRSDQLPVQKAPGRVAVTHQDRRAPAFVHVMEAPGGAVKPSRVKWVELG